MHSIPLWRVILMISLIGLGGCAMGSAHVNPYFEMPPDRLLKAELELYNRALEQLKNNHPEDSINLWKRFLEHRPRSFRGYNNLGMAYYSNDQLEKSIIAFETALTLEPFDLKIKDNLKRSLRFQITIQSENKDYEKAIQSLERVKKLTDLAGKEKVELDIETFQDLIFEQVKQANTLENYETFLAKYPDSPKNSDEARRQIAKMKPRDTPLGEFPELQDELLTAPGQRPTRSLEEAFVPDPFMPEPMERPPASSPVYKETIEIVAETKKPDEGEEMSAEMQDELMDPVMEEVSETAKPSAVKRPKTIEPMAEPALDPGMEMKREKLAIVSSAPEPHPTKRVRIMTRNTPLRVREKPDAQSKVVAQIRKGLVVPVFEEAKDWFWIEYQKGKKGWISKKYSKLVP